MRFYKAVFLNRFLRNFLFASIALALFSSGISSAQEKNSSIVFPSKKFSIRQDSANIPKRKAVVAAAEPDTNFTWERYANFLKKVADTSKYIVLPLNEFRQTFDSKKIIIGLRHDVDNDLDVAYNFSQVEYNLGFRSTYFILHTAPYYLVNPNNMNVHNEEILPKLKSMQNDRHFEIGWHNDLVTLQVVYNINPVNFLHTELAWLRSNDLKIYGTASHGSNYCKTYHYLNYYFFEECTWPIVPNYENNITVPKDGKQITLIKGKLMDFDLQYEAYFLNNNKAFSDATISSGVRWNIGMLDLTKLQPGDRAIILLHPIHWHKASTRASIDAFSFPGEINSEIDSVNRKIYVDMPFGVNTAALTAGFIISPGAQAKIAGKVQMSKVSQNNFLSPVVYTIYAENRDIRTNWTVYVNVHRNSEADITAFSIPGHTKSVLINTARRSVIVEVDTKTDLKNLIAHFSVSANAKAYIGDFEITGSEFTGNFNSNIQMRIVSEDGTASNIWTISVKRTRNLADFVSFNFNGSAGQTRIDTSINRVDAELLSAHRLDSIRPSFTLSDNSKAWIGSKEQISDYDFVDFTNPVVYTLISKDSTTIKNWTVSIRSLQDDVVEKPVPITLNIYPNPSSGRTHLHFSGVKNSPSTVDIFNSMGEKVFTEQIMRTGDFTVDEDLKRLCRGVYFVHHSEMGKSGIVLIKKD